MSQSRQSRSSVYKLTARPKDQSLYEWIKDILLLPRSPFRKDFDADGASAETLRAIVDGDVEGLSKLTVDGDARVTVCETQFTLFDLAWVCFMMTPSDSTYDILLRIVNALGLSEKIRTYDLFASHVSFTAERLRSLTNRIVANSNAPIGIALMLASRCRKLAKKHVGRYGLLLNETRFCTNLSIELLKNIGNEHLAALALQVRDPALGGSALDVALSTNNMEFIADPLVSRILFNIWAVPRYLKQSSFSAPGYLPVHYRLDVLLQRNPKQFLETNRVKFQLHIISLWAYVLLASYSALSRVGIQSSITDHELAVWILGIGYIAVEVAEAQRITLERYLRSGWNCVGVCLWTAMLIEAIVRLLGFRKSFDDSSIEGAQAVFWICESVFIILLWLKLTRQFTVLPTVGVLNRTLPLLAGYIAHFSLFLAVFCMGFGIALTYVVGDVVESYRTVFGAWFTLYQGALAQYSFSDFEALTSGKRIVGQTLLGIFLLISTLILLKTMIVAILNSTYRRVRDHSELEYGFGFAHLIVETHAENAVLPAPLNVLVWILSSPMLAWSTISRQIAAPVDGWKCAYCYSQNPVRNGPQILDVLKSWMQQLEVSDTTLLESLPLQEIELCSKCSSLKKPITDSENILGQVSFCLFFIVIWLPITLLLWIQRFFLRAIRNLAKLVPKKTTYRTHTLRLRPHKSTYRSSITMRPSSSVEGLAVQVSINPCEKHIRTWVSEHVSNISNSAKPSISRISSSQHRSSVSAISKLISS